MIRPESCKHEDWVSNSRSSMLAWGLPGLTLIAGVFLEPSTRTVMWAGALVWMGVACLANAARCGRTHCYFTGPYFLTLAIVTTLHGFQNLFFWLGAYGWLWLGLMIVAGGGAVWFLTEKVWGKFLKARKAFPESHTVEKCVD